MRQARIIPGALRACFLVGVLTAIGAGPLGDTAADDSDELVGLRAMVARLQGELEKARETNQKLEEELAALRRKLAGPTGATPPRPAARVERARVVPFPDYKVTGLGMIQGRTTKLADAVAGATEVRLRPLVAAESVASLSVRANEKSTAILFACETSGKPPVTVASLALKPDGLHWRWEAVFLTNIGDSLAALKSWLRASIIELHSGTGPVAAYQFEPIVVEISSSRTAATVPLAELSTGANLKAGKAGTGWRFENAGEGRLRLSHGETSMTLSLDTQAKAFRAEWETGSTERVRELDEEIRSWKADNEQLAEMARVATGTTKTLIEKQIAINKERTVKLTAERAKVLAKISTVRPVAKLTECEAAISLPNGVELYRIKFKK